MSPPWGGWHKTWSRTPPGPINEEGCLVSAEEYYLVTRPPPPWCLTVCQGLGAYPGLILDGSREQGDGVLFRNASLDCFLAQPLQPRFSVKCSQVEQPCTENAQMSVWSATAREAAAPTYFSCFFLSSILSVLGRGAVAHLLTNSVLWWQVNSVCVEILEKGSVHQVRELVDLYGVLIAFIQQRTEMLTSGQRRERDEKKLSLVLAFYMSRLGAFPSYCKWNSGHLL